MVLSATGSGGRVQTDDEITGLNRGDLADDPFDQFSRWLETAVDLTTESPAMILGTADGQGRPSSRTVLLKGYDRRGLVFFTNYESRKAVELAENPRASLLFLWDTPRRQVRIEGVAERVDPGESDAYFATRPPGSRVGAAVSPQSRVIPDRGWLEERVSEVLAEYPAGDVPRPAHWGGYRVVPDHFEFWQGRLDRLHDRFRYRLVHEEWVIERLAP